MKILWLKTELLHPVDKGGKIRTYHLLKQLKTDHHITYLTLDDGTAPPDAAERATEDSHDLISIPHATREKVSAAFYAELALNMTSSLPYAIRKYKSNQMKKAIEDITAKDRFDVVVCDGFTGAKSYIRQGVAVKTLTAGTPCPVSVYVAPAPCP